MKLSKQNFSQGFLYIIRNCTFQLNKGHLIVRLGRIDICFESGNQPEIAAGVQIRL